MDIDISVIILSYNQVDTIGRALDSVLAQKVDCAMEIVVADDCSTDGTDRVVSEYIRRYPERIRLLPRQSNMGLRANYFDALDHCRGRYIADCAGDDFWTDPLKLQKQFALLESHPEVTLVHTDWQVSNLDGSNPQPFSERPHKEFGFTPAGELVVPLLRHDRRAMIHLSTALYRKDIFDRIDTEAPQLFRDPLNRCEDLPIEVVMAASGCIAYIPDITLNYCSGHTSVSNPADPGRIFDQYWANLYQTHALAEHFHIVERELTDYYTTTLLYLAAQTWRSHDRSRRARFEWMLRTLPAARHPLKLQLYRLAMILL